MAKLGFGQAFRPYDLHEGSYQLGQGNADVMVVDRIVAVHNSLKWRSSGTTYVLGIEAGILESTETHRQELRPYRYGFLAPVHGHWRNRWQNRQLRGRNPQQLRRMLLAGAYRPEAARSVGGS